MKRADRLKRSAVQSEVLGAALRYCAVADWFESRPCSKHTEESEAQAMDLLNRVEAQLRQAGTAAMRQHGHRALVLEAAGVPRDQARPKVHQTPGARS